MKRQNQCTQKFLVDTNIFVAAIKSKDVGSLRLLANLITSSFDLIANDVLIVEYEYFGSILSSDLTKKFYSTLINKTKVINPEEKYVEKCRPYFPNSEPSDVVHAATCLREDAILISNDKDFRPINGLIKVWNISDAMNKLVSR